MMIVHVSFESLLTYDPLPMHWHSLIETVHAVLCVLFIYHYFVVRFGDTEHGLDRVYW